MDTGTLSIMTYGAVIRETTLQTLLLCIRINS